MQPQFGHLRCAASQAGAAHGDQVAVAALEAVPQGKGAEHGLVHGQCAAACGCSAGHCDARHRALGPLLEQALQLAPALCRVGAEGLTRLGQQRG